MESGTIAELWRYPVKSMRGERCRSLALDTYGVAGDRRFAFLSTAAPLGKPVLHSRERTRLLLYAARTQPDGSILVAAPTGEEFTLNSHELLAHLQRRVAEPGATLTLHESVAPQTDVRPVALQTVSAVEALSKERDEVLDSRRFRSNLILDIPLTIQASSLHLRFPSGAVLRVLETIPRCRIISLSPATAIADPTLLRHLSQRHAGRFGVYASATCAGALAEGDAVEFA